MKKFCKFNFIFSQSSNAADVYLGNAADVRLSFMQMHGESL